MTKLEYKNKTIYDLIFEQKNLMIDFLMIISSVVFLAVMSNIRVPLWPVPVTMQTFGIFMISFFFGSKKGTISILTYLLAGVLGFGVFSGEKAGITAFLGPTGGYLIGFIFMAYFTGKMIEKGYGKTKNSVLLCMITGEAILYSFGLSWLWLFLGKPGIITLLMAGLVPFIIGDALKIAVAMYMFPKVWNSLEKIKN